jgi:hypothetical protein
MNNTIIKAIGDTSPPESSINKSKLLVSKPSNTISTTSFGDIVLLIEKNIDDDNLSLGKIKSIGFTSLSGYGTESENIIHELPFDSDNLKEFSKYDYRNMEFNSDNTILLLWSENDAGIIELPRKLFNKQDGSLILPMDLIDQNNVCIIFIIIIVVL